MSKVSFTTHIHQFEEQGEKTGWTYIQVPSDIVEALKPGNKKTFRVKGQLDQWQIKSMALLPMGDGSFIMALNASIRKGIRKKAGAMLHVVLEVDDSPRELLPELLDCLAEEPEAAAFFQTLAPSHQRYFSKWIQEAKTIPTQTRRLALTLSALSRKMDYGSMIREQKGKNQ